MKAENKQLRNWYSSLPRNDFRQKREQIIDNCGITRAIFNNWIQGITVIPAKQYNDNKINKIFFINQHFYNGIPNTGCHSIYTIIKTSQLHQQFFRQQQNRYL